jgi:ABC-2 type transport system permease protein
MNGAFVLNELKRTMRNPRAVLFTFAFPVVMYFLLATPNRHEQSFGGSGIPVVLYYVVSLASWGAMGSMVATGGRIAAERAVGWNRQLRITPLSPLAYIGGKVAVGYALALLTIIVLFVASLTLGADYDVSQLLEMMGLMLVGLIPFALFGIAIGHVITPDIVGPVMGGVMGLLPIISGTWFPIDDSGFMHDVAVALPSYWLVQASHVMLGGSAWGIRGWVTIAIWSALLARLAIVAYRRDTARH